MAQINALTNSALHKHTQDLKKLGAGLNGGGGQNGLNGLSSGFLVQAGTKEGLPRLNQVTSARSTRSNRTVGQSAAVFAILDWQRQGTISTFHFIEALKKTGIELSDPRLAETVSELKERGGLRRDLALTIDDFLDIIEQNIVFINKIFQGKLIIPDFVTFTDEITKLFNQIKKCKSGEVSTFTPDLARVDPDLFSVSVCTVDGQRLDLGDSHARYTCQGLSKPISYLMALQENGITEMAKYVGTEPSGDQKDTISLKKISRDKQIPHNPIVDTGAIMVCSLIKRKCKGKTMAERFGHSMNTWSKAMGGERVGFDNPNYLSQKSRDDRPWCLAHLMNEHRAFPENTELTTTLDFYFQNNALEITNHHLSAVAATMANGGTCPLSGEVIWRSEYVRNCLSVLMSSGMYESSGRWSFEIGLPAMGSCSGGLFIVIPNKMGIAIYSPRLTKGISTRGVTFAKTLVDHFNFHQYDNLRGVLSGPNKKLDPCSQTGMDNRDSDMYRLEELLFAAAEGDLKEVQRVAVSNVLFLFEADYDMRTALHLAASEGHHRVVRFLIEQCETLPEEERITKLSPRDRWQRTPLDDAYSGEHKRVIDLLKKAGAYRGQAQGTIHFRGGLIRSSTFLKLKSKPPGTKVGKKVGGAQPPKKKALPFMPEAPVPSPAKKGPAKQQTYKQAAKKSPPAVQVTNGAERKTSTEPKIQESLDSPEMKRRNSEEALHPGADSSNAGGESESTEEDCGTSL